MDLSPDDFALLAAIIHGDDAKTPLDLVRACHPAALAGLLDSGMVAVWANDQPRDTVTLTPLAAQWLGVEIAERLRLITTEVWEKGEDGSVGGWARAETMVIAPYWARTPRGEDEGRKPIDDPAFGRVPNPPLAIKLPARPGEYPLPFPDLVPDHRRAPEIAEDGPARSAGGRKDRGKPRRAG